MQSCRPSAEILAAERRRRIIGDLVKVGRWRPPSQYARGDGWMVDIANGKSAESVGVDYDLLDAGKRHSIAGRC
jgi:hypothetical protein